MRVADAREVAADWVREQAGPELIGAFLTGSAALGAGDHELAATSDLDLIMITDGPAPAKIGKLWRRGVLLDVSSLALAELDLETVLGTSFLAPFVAGGRILHDPTCRLSELQQEVRPLVDRPEWVRARVAEVRTKITNGLAPGPVGADLAHQVMGWVFPASLPAVLLLVAAGRPPTVRTRYLRCRELLAGLPPTTGGAQLSFARPGSSIHAPLEVYEDLLRVLGCPEVTADRVQRHLVGLADTLQIAARFARTEFPFSSDLRPDVWHLTLDGSAELVRAGWHREAVWWILATYARCLFVLEADAPADVVMAHGRRLTEAADELIGFFDRDEAARADSVRRLVPEVVALAETLIVGAAE